MNEDNNLEESIDNKYVLYNKAKKNLSLTIEESIYILKRKDFRDDLEDIAVETVLNELEKKDKIINLMAERLEHDTEWFFSEFDDYKKQDFIEYAKEYATQKLQSLLEKE